MSDSNQRQSNQSDDNTLTKGGTIPDIVKK